MPNISLDDDAFEDVTRNLEVTFTRIKEGHWKIENLKSSLLLTFACLWSIDSGTLVSRCRKPDWQTIQLAYMHYLQAHFRIVGN